MYQTRRTSRSVPTSIGSSEFFFILSVLFQEHLILTLLRPNVPLSATTQRRIRLKGHTPYIPPHPQQGTSYHRYVLLLLPQPPLDNVAYTLNTEARAEPGVPTSQSLDIPLIQPEERANFDVRAFVQHWGLNIVPGGGAHMWREVWNQKVSKIYRSVLSKSLLPCYHFESNVYNLNVTCRGAGTTVRQVSKGGPLCRVQAKEALYLIRLYFDISALIEVQSLPNVVQTLVSKIDYEVYRLRKTWKRTFSVNTRHVWILCMARFPEHVPEYVALVDIGRPGLLTRHP